MKSWSMPNMHNLPFRTFVQVDAAGNTLATLESPYPPGEDRNVVPSNFVEVTGQAKMDWLAYRWTGQAFQQKPVDMP